MSDEKKTLVPLPVIMTMSQPDLDYITANNGNVGAVGSFTGNATCPRDPIHQRPTPFMHCCITAPVANMQVLPANLAIDECPYKIVIHGTAFGINIHTTPF